MTVKILLLGRQAVQGQGGSPLSAVCPQVRHKEAVPGQTQHDRHRQQHQVKEHNNNTNH